MDAKNLSEAAPTLANSRATADKVRPMRRYLPQHQVHALLDQSSLATARPCDSHLNALLHAVSTYLPRYLVNEQLHDL